MTLTLQETVARALHAKVFGAFPKWSHLNDETKAGYRDQADAALAAIAAVGCNRIEPEFIEAGAKALAEDFDYLSQWGKNPPTGTNYTQGYWRELFTRAVQAGNAALGATEGTDNADGR